MPKVKQVSKRKRVTKAAIPALGAAGLTFSMVGGASAAVAPTADTPLNVTPTHEFTLGMEELSDVSLATFHVFDKENTGSVRGMVQEARGCGCGGRGCGGRGCGGRGCGGRGCGCGGGGCGCVGCGVGCAACCLSFGCGCKLC